MGEVFRARDDRIGRDVAIKVLPASFAADADRLLRFEQEARSAGTLNHPNLITIYDIGKDDGAPYIVMELLDGETLRDKLSSRLPDRKKNLLSIADAADAIAAAHRAGVIHRDLKPENIIVTESGYTKVLDFGLAKLAVSTPPQDSSVTEVRKTDPGIVVGTAGYMAPEQAQGKPADERSDIFSLGCILYEALTGKRPFAGATSLDTLHNVVHSEPPSIPSATPELQRIVRKALAKDPNERYQSAKDLSIDLRAAVRELGSSSGAHPVTRKRGAALRLIAAVALAAIAAAAAWMLARRPSRSVTPLAIQALTNSGDVIEAAISPDGKYLAYVTSRAGQQAMWLRQIGTAQSILLVPPAHGEFWQHAFTPDGSAIFFGMKKTDSLGALYRIATLGGVPEKVLSGIESGISFSPDGKQLAYLRAFYPTPHESALMIANIDGTNIRALATKREPERFVPIFFGGPSWSPDGKRIACSVVGASRGRLAEFDVSSGAERVIAAPDWREAAQVVWAPGGHALYVIAGATVGISTRLWRVEYPDGDAQAVTAGAAADYRNPSITADGKAIAIISAELRGKLGILTPDGKLVENIGQTTRDGVSGVAFAPDGRVVYTSQDGDNMHLWICDRHGGNREQLTSGQGVNREPFVTRDGRIVFFKRDKNITSLWQMRLDRSDAKRIADAPPAGHAATDGSTVYFDTGAGTSGRLLRVSIDGGKPVEFTDFRATYPTVSADGRVLAAVCWIGNDVPRIAMIDRATGRIVRRFDATIPDHFSRVAISGDGSNIYYSVNAFIYAVDVASGEQRMVIKYDPPDSPRRLDVGPDGTLVVSYATFARDAYLITGFD